MGIGPGQKAGPASILRRYHKISM